MSLPEPGSTQPSATEPPSPVRPAPDVQPMEVDLTLLLSIGSALFALSFAGLLTFHGALSRAGHGNWPWIALAGTVFGLLGLLSVRRRARPKAE